MASQLTGTSEESVRKTAETWAKADIERDSSSNVGLRVGTYVAGFFALAAAGLIVCAFFPSTGVFSQAPLYATVPILAATTIAFVLLQVTHSNRLERLKITRNQCCETLGRFRDTSRVQTLQHQNQEFVTMAAEREKENAQKNAEIAALREEIERLKSSPPTDDLKEN